MERIIQLPKDIKDTAAVFWFQIGCDQSLKLCTQTIFSCKKMLTVCTNACRFHNQLVKNLLQVVAQKNLNLSRKIQFMSQKTPREKLMAYLLDCAKRAGNAEFRIPFDRQALADYLGVERSAMSAELGKLQKDGILRTKGSNFCLLKPDQDADLV